MCYCDFYNMNILLQKTGEMIIEECNTALEQNELLKVLERLSTTREHNREMRNALESKF